MKRESLAAMIVMGVAMIMATIAKADTTFVSGIISTNTVWDTAGSPYIVTGNVKIDTLVTLTVEPGVKVKFKQDKDMQIVGTLEAMGTVVDSIIISAYDTTRRWGRLWFKGGATGNLKYCRIEWAGSSIYNENADSLYICYSTISYNSAAYGGGIYNSGTATITGNTISHNSANYYGGGICNYGTATIINNTIFHNSASYGGGIYNYGTATITGNTISNNSVYGGGGGICNSGTATIKYNTITDTTASAIYIASDSALIDSNNLYTTYYAVYNGSSCNIDARYNYWGTTDSAAIANQRIWDYYDDSYKGVAYYQPFLFDTVGVEEKTEVRRQKTEVRLEVYPNPSFGNTAIKYSLPAKTKVSLEIYDISGRLVKTIYSGIREKGDYRVELKNDELVKGIYFMTLNTDNYKESKKIVVVK